MATKTAPVLSTISAFDAQFAEKNLSAPVLRFTWADGLIKKSRVQIREYDSPHSIVYDHTVDGMVMKHVIDSTAESYKLINGTRYIAVVYVYPDDTEESPASNEVIFYCFSQPTFEFQNFTDYFNDEIAIVETSSIILRVFYSQGEDDDKEREKLNSYQFKILNTVGDVLTTSPTKYSNEYEVTLRHTFGGIDDTITNAYGDFEDNCEYIAICSGVTTHGIELHIEQKFVVKSVSTGVGALISAENKGDGTVSIISNYKIMNANCSVDPPIYQSDENGEPYAVDLTNSEYVEFTDGFVMKYPYEVIFSGYFKSGKLVTLKSVDGYTGYIYLEENLNTSPALSYYLFTIEDNEGNILFKTRTNYWYYDIMVRQDTLIFNEDELAAIEEDTVVYKSDVIVADISNGSMAFPDNSEIIKIKLTCQDSTFDLDFLDNQAIILPEEEFTDITDISLSPQKSNVPLNYVDYVRIENGIYDDLYLGKISKTTDTDSFDVPDIWTVNTYLHAKFNGTLFSGNTDFGVENTSHIIVKRREKGTYQWMPIRVIEVDGADDYNFVTTDLYPSSGITYEYAAVPIINGIETEYVITECYVSFDRLVIIDQTGTYNTALDIEIGQTKNNTSSTILPIGCRYPISVSNSANDYYTGNISATFIPWNENLKDFVFITPWDDPSERKIKETSGVISISKYRAQVLDFLNNRLVKYIKDPYGHAWLAFIGTTIEDSDNGHVAAHSISFDFTEVGDTLSNSDMYKFGLLDVGQEWW